MIPMPIILFLLKGQLQPIVTVAVLWIMENTTLDCNSIEKLVCIESCIKSNFFIVDLFSAMIIEDFDIVIRLNLGIEGSTIR